MIQVMVLILVSAILSLRISASSRKTLQRSLRTWMRGVISRYSRMPVYRGCRVGSESQKKFGTSRILDARNRQWMLDKVGQCNLQRLTSTLLLKRRPSI